MKRLVKKDSRAEPEPDEEQCTERTDKEPDKAGKPGVRITERNFRAVDLHAECIMTTATRAAAQF